MSYDKKDSAKPWKENLPVGNGKMRYIGHFATEREVSAEF